MSLLVFSLIFYAWGEPKYVLLLMFMSLCSWFCALRVERAASTRRKRAWVAVSCAIDIALIGFFKYAGLICSVFGEVPEFTDPEMSMAWGFVARYVDNDRKRYEAKCERARARAMKRWEQDEEAPEEADEDASYTDAKTKTKSKTKQNHNQKQKQTPAIPESVENPVESYAPRSAEEFEALRRKALDRLSRGMSFSGF